MNLGQIIHIELDSYLADFWIHENGNGKPVVLHRGCPEFKLISLFVRYDGAPHAHSERSVPVLLPKKLIRQNLFPSLPEAAHRQIRKIIRNRFDIKIFNDLHTFENITSRQDEMLFLWMENNGIEINERNWNAICKRFQRLRTTYRNRLRQQKKRKK